MKIGLVGKPSVGKSTFFKAATLMDVDIANYPFTTIKPNTGFAHVVVDCVDKELNTSCNPRTGFCIKNRRYVPFELIDVAGLVPGAHQGKGRGLSFLSDLNEADGLIHVVDASGSSNSQGEDISPGSHDPCDDIRFLEDELDHWYKGIISKGLDKLKKKIMQEKLDPVKVLFEQLSGLRVTEEHLKEAFKKLKLPLRADLWSDDDMAGLSAFLRKKTKPIVIAANKIDRPFAEENFIRMKKTFHELKIIPCSAEVELALREAAKHSLIDYLSGEESFSIKSGAELSEKQIRALDYMRQFLDKHGNTGVQQVMNTIVFDVLKYIAVFPGGVKKLEDSEGRRLPDCFLMPPKTTVLDFAGYLHSDFAKYFVRAVDVKTRLPVAKDHLLSHRDVIEIISAK